MWKGDSRIKKAYRESILVVTEIAFSDKYDDWITKTHS